MIGTSYASGASSRQWVVLSLIAGVAAFVVVLYAETFSSMAAIWRYSDYRYGLIVFPICAYLLWRLRGSLAGVEIRPCAWTIPPLAVGVATWLVARAAGVQVVEQLAAVLLIPGAVAAFLGWGIFRRAMFPLMFLVAAVPVGDGMVPTLMLLTANIASGLLTLVGMPVFREGQLFHLPGGDFEVAHVCSGLGFTTAGSLIAILFSYLTYRSALKRLVFVVLTAAVMMVANGIRAFIVMYVASATNMRYLAGRDHVFFGWIMFGALVVALMYAGGRFADRFEEPGGSVESSGPKRARLWPVVLVSGLAMLAATAQPLHAELGDSALMLWPAAGLLLWTLYRTVDYRPSESRGSMPEAAVRYASLRGFVVLGFVPLILALGPYLQPKRAPAGRVENVVEWPLIGECGRVGDWSESWRPEFRKADVVVSGSYLCAGQHVNVFIATYAGDLQGRELVNQSNRAVPEALEQRATVDRHSFTGKDGEAVTVNELQVESSKSSALIWYWYRAGRDVAASPTFVKVERVLGLLLRRPADDGVYVLVTSLDGLDSSRRRLAAVARALTVRETAGESVVSREK